MSISRREFLRTTAVLGTAAAVLTPLTQLPTWLRSGKKEAAPRVTQATILVAASPATEAFERGVRAGFLSTGRAESQLATHPVTRLNMAEWQAHLSEKPGAVVVGMVHESDYIVLNEWIRESGARLLYQATHVAGGDTRSRHTFSTTAASMGLGAMLARWLDEHQQHALVQEHALALARRALFPQKRPESAALSWPECLGQAAAQVALGRWQPAVSAGLTRVGHGGDFAASTAGYVSFVCHT